MNQQNFSENIKFAFYLKAPKKNIPTAIIFRVTYKGQRYNFGTGVKIIPIQWNESTQRAFVSFRLPELCNRNNEIVNYRLDEMQKSFESLRLEIANNPDYLTNFAFHLKKKFMIRKKKEVQLDIFQIINLAIISSTKAEGTKDNYKRGLEAFKSFITYRKESGNAITGFKDINTDLINELSEYLSAGKYKKDLSVRTINDLVRYAVAAIKLVPSEHLPKSQAQNIKAISLEDKTSDKNEISLRDDEVMKLWRYEPTSDRDKQIKDLFLLACTTGQRISDISKVAEGVKEKNGIKYFSVVQEKTSEKVEVPILFQIADNILNKYGSTLPSFDRSAINKRIKVIAKEAGITGIETISHHKIGNDKPIVEKKERYELIGTHTGRRTFVGLLLVRGKTYEEISQYTGHKTTSVIGTSYDKTNAMDRKLFEKLSDSDKVKMIEDKPAITLDDVTEKIFPIKSMLQLIDLEKSGLNISEYSDIINKALLILKDVKGFTDKLKGKIKPIPKDVDKMIREICYRKYDSTALKTYDYKLYKLGLSNDKPLSDDKISMLWESEDRYRENIAYEK